LAARLGGFRAVGVESAVWVGERGKHAQYCFTYNGRPIRWGLCNTAWPEAVKRAGLTDFC
jgi:hypothetical protein